MVKKIILFHIQLILLISFYSCSKSSSPSGASSKLDGSSLAIVSGDSQFAPVSSNFQNPLVVQISGPDDIKDVPINFQIISGATAATLDNTLVYTDSTGNAQTTVTTTPTAGIVSVRATVTIGSDTHSVSFTLFVNGNAVDWRITKVNSGNETAGTAIPLNIEALLTSGTPDPDFDGAKYLSFSTTAGDSPDGIAPTLPTDGFYNFTDGVIDTPLNALIHKSSDNVGETFTITVNGSGLNDATTAAFNVDDAAVDGIRIVDTNLCDTANEISDQTIVIPTPVSMYVLNFDAYGNCVNSTEATVTANWSKTFLDTQLTYDTSTTGAANMTMTPILGGFTGTLGVTDAADGSRTDSTGTITISSGSAANFFITGMTSAGNYATTAGVQQYLVIEVRDAFGNISTGYDGAYPLTFTTTANSTAPPSALAIAANPPALPTNTTYTFSNGLLISPTPFVTLYNSNENPTITVSDGSINGTTPALVVNSTPHTYSLITSAANNAADGFDATAAIRTADDTYNLYCATYDSYGNFLGDDATADWTPTGVITAGEISPGLINQATIAYSPSNTGSGTITCNAAGISDGTGSFNIVPGIPSYFKLDGGAGDDNPFTVNAGDTFPVTVKVYDSDNNFCTNYNSSINTTVTYLGATAVNPAHPSEISPTYTSAAIDGTDITAKAVTLNFTAGDVDIPSNRLINSASGADRVRVQVVDDINAVTAATTGFITVNNNVLASVVIRDAANNAGNVVGAMSTDNDTPVTFYAAGYDSSGNYIGDQSVTWSTTAGTSSCADGDLSTTIGTNAIFDPADAGTCTVNIDAGSGITDSTGTITVTNGAIASFHVEVNGAVTTVTAGSDFTAKITALDADGERVLNYVPDSSFTLTHTNGTAPEGQVPDSWTLLGSDFVLGQATVANLKTYDAGSTFTMTATETGTGSATGTSVTITVNPNTLHHFSTTNSAGPFTADGTSTFNVDIEARDEWGNPTTTGITTHQITSLTAIYNSGDELLVDTIGGFSAFNFAGGSDTETVVGLTYRVSHEVHIVATNANGDTTPVGLREAITFAPHIDGLVSYDIDTFSTTTATAGVAFTATVVAKDVMGNTITGIDTDLEALAYAFNSAATNSDYGSTPNHPSYGAGTLNFTNGVSDPVTYTFYNDETVLASSITVNNGVGETGDAGSNDITVAGAALHHYSNDEPLPAAIPTDGSPASAFQATINARDQYGNVVPGSATVTLDIVPSDGHTKGTLTGSTVLNLTSGTTIVNDLKYTAAGFARIDADDGSISMDMTRSTNYEFGANPNSVDNFLVELVDGATVTAGDSTFTLRITARDNVNNTIDDDAVDTSLNSRNYTISGFGSSPEGTMPTPNAAFNWSAYPGTKVDFADGVATIDITLVEATTVASITVTDNTGGVVGTLSTPVTVNPDVIDHISITGAAAGTADDTTTYTATVNALDQFGNLTQSASATDSNLTLTVDRISGVANTGTLGGSITGIDLMNNSQVIINDITYPVAHSTRFNFTTAPTVSIDNTLTPIVTWAMDPLTVASYTFVRTESTQTAGVATAYRITAFDAASNQIVGEDAILDAMTFTPSVADGSCNAPNGTVNVIDSFTGAGAATTGAAFGGFTNGVMDMAVTFYNVAGCVTQNYITITDVNGTTVQNSNATTGPMSITSNIPAYYHTEVTGFSATPGSSADAYRAETAQTGTSVLISQYDTYGNPTLGGGIGTFLSIARTAGYTGVTGTLRACSTANGDGCALGVRQDITAISVDFTNNSTQTIYDLSYDVANTIEMRVDNGSGVTTESQAAQTNKETMLWDLTQGTVASYTFANPAGPLTSGVAANWVLTAFDNAGNQIGGTQAQGVLNTLIYTVTEQTAGKFDAPDGLDNFDFTNITLNNFNTSGQANVSLTLYSDDDILDGDFLITDNYSTPVSVLNTGGTTTLNAAAADRFTVVTANLVSPTANNIEKPTADITVECIDEFGNPTNSATTVSLQAVNVSDGQTYGTAVGTFQLATTDAGGAVDIAGISLDFSSATTHVLYDAAYDVGHDVYIRAYDGTLDTVYPTDTDLIEWVAVNETIDSFELTRTAATAIAGTGTDWTITAYDAAGNTMSNENSINKGLLDALTYTITDNSGGATMNGPETGTVDLPVSATLVWNTDGTATFTGADDLHFYHAVNDVQNDDLLVTDSLGNTGTNNASAMDILPTGVGDHFHVVAANMPQDADNTRKNTTSLTVTLQDEYGNLTTDTNVTAATLALSTTAGYATEGTLQSCTSAAGDGCGSVSDVEAMTLNFTATDTHVLHDLQYTVAHNVELLVADGSVANNTFNIDSDDMVWNPSTAMVTQYDLSFDSTNVNAGTATTMTLTARDAAGNLLNAPTHQTVLNGITYSFTTDATNDAPNATQLVANYDPTDGTKTYVNGSISLSYTFFREGTVATGHVTVDDDTNSITKNSDNTIVINQEVPAYYSTAATGTPNAVAVETAQDGTNVTITQHDTYGNLTTGGGSGTFLSFVKDSGDYATLGTMKACSPSAGDNCAFGARQTISAISVDFASNDTQVIYDLSYDVANVTVINVNNGSGVTTSSQAEASVATTSWAMVAATIDSYTFVNPAGPLTAGVAVNWTLNAFDAAGNQFATNAETVLDGLQYTVTDVGAQFSAPDTGDTFDFTNQNLTWGTDGAANVSLTLYSDIDVDDGDLTIDTVGDAVASTANSGGTVINDHNTAAEVIITTAPHATGTAGVNLVTQPAIKITDIYGNTVDDGTYGIDAVPYVTADCSTTASTGTTNHSTVNTASGLAAFTDLNHEKNETIYYLIQDTGDTLTAACSTAINVDHNVATNIQFTTEPATTAVAGVNFTTQPTVTLYDAYGNIADNMTPTITLSAYTTADCSTTASVGTFNQTPVAISSATATFAGTNHEMMETIYIRAAGGGLTDGCSNAVAVDHNTETALEITVEPHATGVAGVDLATQPSLRIIDAYGNTVDDGAYGIDATPYTTADCSTTASTGTTVHSAVTSSSGIISFADLEHQKDETVYFLIQDTGDTLTGACTAGSNIDHAAASQVALITQPHTTGTAGVNLTTQPTLEIRDIYNNIVDDGTYNIDAVPYITADCSTTASTGTTNHSAVATASGLASFTDLNHEKDETIYYLIQDTGDTLTAACSTASDIDHNVATNIQFTTEPAATAVAAVNFTTQPTVTLYDAYGNIADNVTPTITLSAYTTADCSTTASLGTFNQTPVAISAATATFTGTNHEMMETIYIRAAGGGLTDGCSSGVVVDHAAATKLNIVTGPHATGTAGINLTTQPSIQIYDAYDNLVDNGTYAIDAEAYTTADCTTTASTGTTNHSAVNTAAGSASFIDLNHEKDEIVYFKIQDTGDTLTEVCTTASDIDHNVATNIQFTTQPSTTTTAGTAFAIQPTVTLYDAYNNIADNVTPTITLSAYTTADCSTTASGGTFNQTPVAISSGTATFAGTNHELMETIYIRAAGGGLTDGCSNAVTIDHAAAAAFNITTQPATTGVSGVDLTTQPAIEILDSYGNLVDDGTYNFDATPYETADCSTTASTGTTNHSAASTTTGIGAFTDLEHQKDETVYFLIQDTGDTLTAACTNGVNVDHAAASQVAITVQPHATGTAGINLTTQPSVQIRDTYGNLVDDGSYGIDAVPYTTPDCSTTASTGTTNHSAVNTSSGSASFTDLNHEKNEIIYYLIQDTGDTLTAACSTVSNIDHNVATNIQFTTQPSTTTTAGTAFAIQPTVTLYDAYNNIADNVTPTITLSAYTTADCSTTASGGTFNQTPVAISSGTATFAGTNHELMETIYIRATGGGLTDGCSNAVTIDHAAAAAFNITTQPATTGVSGVDLTTQPAIEILDSYGNLVDDGTYNFDATPYETADCSTTASTGTTNHSAASTTTGIGAFTDLEHQKDETVYFLIQDTGDTLTGSCTNAVNIDHGSASVVAITTGPHATGTAGVDLATQPSLEIRDAYGNVVDDGTYNIDAVAYTTADCSTTASTGTTNHSAVSTSSGTASFTDLNHEKNENVYFFIQDTGDTLTGTCSTVSNIDHNVATNIQFTTQPSTSATAGAAFVVQPTVSLYDAYGNVADNVTPSITLSAYTTADCSTTTSSGTFNQSAENIASGTATFSGTNHELMETIYIRAAGGGLTNGCSNAVAVDHAAASDIFIDTAPSSTATAGAAFVTQPVVEIHDTFGNLVDDGTYTINAVAYTTADCSTTAAGNALNYTAPSSSSGTASFTNINHETMETIYIHLQDSGASLNAACTGSITVDHAAASQIVFATQPSGTATAGTNFATQPSVELHDAYGNLADNVTPSITLSAWTTADCSTTASGGTFNQSAENIALGTATFSGTNHEMAETIYVRADDGGGLTDVCSTAITVNPAADSYLEIATGPSSTGTAGTAFATQPVIEIKDAYGNTTNSTANVTLAAHDNSGCSSTAPQMLQGTLTVAASSGSASFAGLNYQEVDTIYLLATSGGLTTACTNAINIAHGSVNQLVFTTQPVANETVNKTFATQPVVEMRDAHGNVITSDSSTSITLTAWSTADCSTTSASGSISNGSVTASSGIATFSTVEHDTAIGTYYLRASDGSRTVCSNVTQVYDALSITPASVTLNTLDTQTLTITGGVPAIVCDDLTTDNSQATITSSCYTGGGCTGDYCIDYQAGYYGNGVSDVVGVHDTANSQNNDSVTITVNGPDFTETSGNGNYGTTGSDTTQTFTIRNDGNAAATSLSVTIGGADAAEFAIGSTDDCTGNGLATSGTCDVDIDFLASGAAASTTFNATITVRGSNGGEIVIPVTGSTP